VLLGALSVAPPAGIVLAIVLAIATRWYQFFYGTFGCSVLCVVSFFVGIEASRQRRGGARSCAGLPRSGRAWAAFASSF